MKYEVENKFRVSDGTELTKWLAALGADLAEPVEQVDRYFAHPSRDFKVTDEALRIRSVGERNYVTYKGPKLDTATKTRRELELPLAPGRQGADDFASLLAALGFQPVAEVCKMRRTARFTWQGHDVEAALDEVDRLGTFAELELSADESGLDAARAALADLAADLGFSEIERRSYLEMLLATL